MLVVMIDDGDDDDDDDDDDGDNDIGYDSIARPTKPVTRLAPVIMTMMKLTPVYANLRGHFESSLGITSTGDSIAAPAKTRGLSGHSYRLVAAAFMVVETLFPFLEACVQTCRTCSFGHSLVVSKVWLGSSEGGSSHFHGAFGACSNKWA